ncbi:hypothetical protein MP228_000980 [Amoeboaphelidium protococcarum]|nr:hypothetical protein MP228_002772 [Amoeboaphelidium protococcarum]KAI3654261.1 hypothetical protein MP228_000980 [Amoeboaphelidium protococcarum]
MSKAAKDPEAPKRATTAFFAFSNEMRAKVKAEMGAEAKVSDVAKELGERWKNMSDAQKKKYSDMAEKDKVRYEKEKNDYQKSGKAEKFAKSVAASGGKGKAKRTKDENAPKKALSAFMFFSKDNRDKIKAKYPTKSFGEIGKQVGEEWNKLSEAQKAPYAKKAEQDKVRYEKELALYQKGQFTAPPKVKKGQAAAVEDDDEDDE